MSEEEKLERLKRQIAALEQQKRDLEIEISEELDRRRDWQWAWHFNDFYLNEVSGLGTAIDTCQRCETTNVICLSIADGDDDSEALICEKCVLAIFEERKSRQVDKVL